MWAPKLLRVIIYDYEIEDSVQLSVICAMYDQNVTDKIRASFH